MAALVSTIANDGVRIAPRIVMGTVDRRKASLQTVAFHPAEGNRVISPYTAAEMRSMMQKVVLEGTGREATLEGYTSAGKTGTGQKVDPATGVYSKTKYVASFAGFAPVNNPQIVVTVILDSAVGPTPGRRDFRRRYSGTHFAAGAGIFARAARSAAGAAASIAAGAGEDERQ
jgi:cell division protein FtsI (penicillin-binding protein 3)